MIKNPINNFKTSGNPKQISPPQMTVGQEVNRRAPRTISISPKVQGQRQAVNQHSEACAYCKQQASKGLPPPYHDNCRCVDIK